MQPPPNTPPNPPQLDESDGRLPSAAVVGASSQLVALGPSFTLEQDAIAPADSADAYVAGRVQPREASASYVHSAFVLPRESNGSAYYYLFVTWFDDGELRDDTSLSRVYVGRASAPTGPFYDRDGFDMAARRERTLGHERLIHVIDARWGANCDGVGYDAAAVVRYKCDGASSCSWRVDPRDLDAIDPLGYATRHSPSTGALGCERDLNVSYE